MGIILENQLKLDDHIKIVFRKISKTIGLLPKLHNAALITIHKAFIRPHLDYGDILYGQAYNMSFHQKLKSIQEMHAWPLLESYEVHRKKSFTKK